MAKHVSTRTQDAMKGGGGIPGGVIVTIHSDTQWVEAREFGEVYTKKRTKGSPHDPVLKLVLEDESGTVLKPEALSAGSARLLVASSDGQYLDQADGSGATGLNKNAGANVFFESLEDKKHGKDALSPDCRDDGIKGIYGVKFVTGRQVIKLDGLEPYTALVADQILGGPGGKKSKKKKDEDDDDVVEKKFPKASKADKDSEEFDAETVAENAVTEALGLPKYRKGIPGGQLYAAVFNVLKEADLDKAQKKEVLDYVDEEENPKWARSSKRSWDWDGDEEVYTEK